MKTFREYASEPTAAELGQYEEPAESPLVDANGYYQGTNPADRIRAFLDTRSQARGMDNEILLSYGRKDTVYELRASDLRALLAQHAEPTAPVKDA